MNISQIYIYVVSIKTRIKIVHKTYVKVLKYFHSEKVLNRSDFRQNDIQEKGNFET